MSKTERIVVLSKRLLALLGCALFAACGARQPASQLPAPVGPGAGTTATAQLTLRVPASQLDSAAAARRPDFISSGVYQFFVDLQGSTNPAFDETLSLTTSNCRADPNEQSWDQCDFLLSEPVGSDALSIAAASSNQLRGTAPPNLLGYAHVTVDVAAARPNPVTVTLDAIASAGSMANSHMTLQFGYAGGTAPSQPYPWLAYELDDASNFPIPFQDAQIITLLNPLTITTDDTSGFIQLAELLSGSPDTVYVPPNGLVNLTSLSTIDGIEILDSLPAGQQSAFEVTMSTPTVTLTDQEFPQIDTFPNPGQPTPHTWSATGVNSVIHIVCGARTSNATVSPCVQSSS